MRRLIAGFGLAALLITPALAQNAPQGGQNRQQARPAANVNAPTLAQVRARGHVLCGVNGTLAGFSAPDTQGVMRGFDADFCRAVATAVFGDPEKVRFLPQATPEGGLDALAARQIDILVRNTTVTFRRDAGRPVTPGPVLFFDGVGFLVPANSDAASPRALGNRTICWAGAADGATGASLRIFADMHRLTGTVRRFDQPAQAVAAMEAGECYAYAADQSQLTIRRITDFRRTEAWRIFPEIISQEPLAPWVRANDEQWRVIVTWTAYVLIQAEHWGISRASLPEFITRPEPFFRNILGLDPGFGSPLGLSDDWGGKVIAAVGNYGDIFDRNLGVASIFGMDRGLNARWTQGGLLYGMPLR
jgi:general L-amino acid transport system substrate-binding protein